MCGICGYYSFGNTLPDKKKLTTMFGLLETRGRDASGFAFIRDKELFIHKAPVKSSIMIERKEWKELVLPKVMILHTRAATQGCNKNNANNHPLFNKEGLAIVHNGIIYNDKEIFGKNQRDGEVDSEAILAVLSSKGKGDKIKRVFERLRGSFAFAVIDKNNPDKLTLVKKDNPIDLYFDVDSDILYFCSERDIMQEALGIETKSVRGFNLGENSFHFYEMKNNYCLTINKDGVESYQKHSPVKFGYNNSYFSSRAVDDIFIECPWCLETTTYHPGNLFNICHNCGIEINEEDLYNV